ncbi:MAG: hypothetical protein EZS28_038864, partial [Streblomastix strix]
PPNLTIPLYITGLNATEEKQPFTVLIILLPSQQAFSLSDEWPCSDENKKKTVCQWSDGELSHIGDGMDGNSRIEMNKTISMEVNMKISPRTLTFFYDNQEQPVSVINIPSSIRFYIYLVDQNSSFTINIFENLQFSSAKGVSGGKPLSIEEQLLVLLRDMQLNFDLILQYLNCICWTPQAQVPRLARLVAVRLVNLKRKNEKCAMKKQ